MKVLSLGTPALSQPMGSGQLREQCMDINSS